MMIWLWVKPRPGGTEYVYFYQHIYPELRGGFRMADWGKSEAANATA